ncbi:MAG TPA: hypothetical protein VFZ53_10970 [Polyangiaceae bacterium]
MESTSHPKLVLASIAVIGALALAIVVVTTRKGQHGSAATGASDSASEGVAARDKPRRTLALPAAPARAGDNGTEPTVAEPPLDDEEAPAGDARPAPPVEAFANPGAARTSNTGTGLVFTAPPGAEAVDVKKKANAPAGEPQTVAAAAPPAQTAADVLPPTSPDAFQNPGERPARHRDTGLVFATPPKTAEGLK